MTKLSFNHFSKTFSSFNWRKTIGIFLLVVFVVSGIIVPLNKVKAGESCYSSMTLCQNSQELAKKNGVEITQDCKEDPEKTKEKEDAFCFEYGEGSIWGATWSVLKGIGNVLFTPIEWAAYQVIHLILYIIWYFLGSLLAFIGGFLDAALLIKNFTQNVSMVREGWGLVRDLCNIFFVLILLIIAFATILRIEAYGIKELLPKLIIAVLLINFSMVICGVIIDFAQILMLSFMPTDGSGYSEILAQGLYMENVFEFTWGSRWDVLASQIFALILIFGATLAFGAVAIFLVIRVVALWLLIIFSPAAWFGWVLPATRQIWSSWWNIFLKYVFYGPIAVFCLWLTAHLVSSGSLEKQIQFTKENVSDISSIAGLAKAGAWIADFILYFINYVFIIVLLIASIIVARTFGIYGAQGVIGAAKWVASGTAGMVSRFLARRAVPGVGLAGRGIGKAGAAIKGWGKKLAEKRGFGGWLGRRIVGTGERIGRGGEIMAATKGRGIWSPGAWKRAWEARRKRAEAESYAEGVGSLEDILDYAYSYGKEYHQRQYRALLRLMQEKLREIKELGDTSPAFLVNSVLKPALKRGGVGGRAEAMAAILQLGVQRDEEQIFGDLELGAQYNYLTNPMTLQKFIKDKIGDDEAGRRFAAAVGGAMKMNRAAQYDYLTYYDATTRRMEWNPKEQQGLWAAIEMSKFEPQDVARYANRRWFGEENEKTGKMVGLHIPAQGFFQRLDRSPFRQYVERMPDYNRSWVIEGKEHILKFADQVEEGYETKYKTGFETKEMLEADKFGYTANPKQAQIIRDWIESLESGKVIEEGKGTYKYKSRP